MAEVYVNVLAFEDVLVLGGINFLYASMDAFLDRFYQFHALRCGARPFAPVSTSI